MASFSANLKTVSLSLYQQKTERNGGLLAMSADDAMTAPLTWMPDLIPAVYCVDIMCRICGGKTHYVERP